MITRSHSVVRDRGLLLAVAALLAGCAGIVPAPLTFEVKDQYAFAADLVACRSYALQGRQTLSAQDVATAGAKGGLENAPGAAVNLTVPLIGALGSAASEALSELNLLGTQERHQVVRCMERKGDKSGAYFVLDPN